MEETKKEKGEQKMMYEAIWYYPDGNAWSRGTVDSVNDAKKRLLKLNKEFHQKYSVKVVDVVKGKDIMMAFIDWDGKVTKFDKKKQTRTRYPSYNAVIGSRRLDEF